MPVHNADIAAAFDEIADLLELQNANPFRIRAYRNAARVAGELRFDSTASARRAAAGWERRACSIPAPSPSCGACSIDDEADLHVDAVPGHTVLVDDRLLTVDPGAPDAVHRLRRLLDAAVHRILEALGRFGTDLDHFCHRHGEPPLNG